MKNILIILFILSLPIIRSYAADDPKPPGEKAEDKTPPKPKSEKDTPAETPANIGKDGSAWKNKESYAFERRKTPYQVIAIFKDKKSGKEHPSSPITVPPLSDCDTKLEYKKNDKGSSVEFDATGSEVDCGGKKTPAQPSEVTWVLECPDKEAQTQTGIKVTFTKSEKECKGTVTYKPKEGPPKEKPIDVPAKDAPPEKEKEPEAPSIATEAPAPQEKSPSPQLPPPQMPQPQMIPPPPMPGIIRGNF